MPEMNITHSGAMSAERPYALNWGLAIAAGLAATLAMTLMLYFVPPIMGREPMDIGMMLGTMIHAEPVPTARWIGLAMHFMNGVIFTLIYAGILLSLHKQSTWVTGLVFGAALWLVAMLMMPVMMGMNPLVQAGKMENPGLFLLNRGADGQGIMAPMFSLITHLVYGAIAGAMYKHARRDVGD